MNDVLTVRILGIRWESPVSTFPLVCYTSSLSFIPISTHRLSALAIKNGVMTSFAYGR